MVRSQADGPAWDSFSSLRSRHKLAHFNSVIMALSHRSNMRSDNCPFVSTSASYTSMCSKHGDYDLLARLGYEQAQLEQTAHQDSVSRTASTNTGSPDPALPPLSGAGELSCTLPYAHSQASTSYYVCERTQPDPQQINLSGRSGAQVFRCFEHGCGGRSFSNIENYRRHIREKTTNIRCPFCEVSFTRKSNRDAHLSSGRCKLGVLEYWGIEGL